MSCAAHCSGLTKSLTTNYSAKIMMISYLSNFCIAFAFALSDMAMYGFMD